MLERIRKMYALKYLFLARATNTEAIFRCYQHDSVPPLTRRRNKQTFYLLGWRRVNRPCLSATLI